MNLFNFFRKNQKTAAILLTTASLATSCKKDDSVTPDLPKENIPVKENKTHKTRYSVDCDYANYVITYRQGRNNPPIKEIIKNQKHWEKTFDAKKDDSLMLSVYVLSGNVQGTRVDACIWVDGVLRKQTNFANGCIDGTCPIGNKDIDLKVNDRL